MLLTAVSFRAQAQPCGEHSQEALRWLAKMSLAWETISYRGVVSIQRGDDIHVVEVAHLAGEHASNDLISALAGRGGAIQSVEHPANCIHPGQKLLRIDSSNDGESGDCGVARYYSMAVTKGQPVADQETVYLHLKPRDMYRYGHLMALDKQTGLLLKAQTMSSQGQVLERFQFARIDYNAPVSDAEVKALGDTTVVHDKPVFTLDMETPNWAPKWLPPGFVLSDAKTSKGRLTYTDGLSVFSVVRELIDEAIVAGEGVVRLGGTVSYTRGIMRANQGVLVTVVGDVPINTARMVADAVIRR